MSKRRARWSWIRVLALAALLGMSQVAVGGPGISIETIKTRYKNLRGFHAEVEQVKSSPLLLRPVTTQVQISLDQGLLTWQASGQEPWQIRFSEHEAPVFINGGPALDSMPAAARQKLSHTLSLVHSLMTMSPKLEEEFQLTLVGLDLTVAPRRPRTDLFFNEIFLSFHPDGSLSSMRFATPDDETKLRFKTLTIDRP